MKIVYGCYPSLFSLLIVNLLTKKYSIPITTLLISNRTVRIDGKSVSTLKGMFYMFKRLGFRFIVYQVLALSLSLAFLKLRYMGSKQKRIMSFQKLSKTYGINMIVSDDFNSAQIIDKIVDHDLFISMCLDQILRQDFIEAFNGKCINVHPSDLPDFRGVDSIFQLLLSTEKNMGITLHYMTPVIDRGEIIAKQFVRRRDSHLFLMKQFVTVGCEMINKFVNDSSFANSVDGNNVCRAEKYPYKSWPSKCEIKEFENRCRYFTPRDMFSWDIY